MGSMLRFADGPGAIALGTAPFRTRIDLGGTTHFFWGQRTPAVPLGRHHRPMPALVYTRYRLALADGVWEATEIR